MSTNLPPAGPPSGPPTGPPLGPPPSGPPTGSPPSGAAEVLEQGGGGPMPPGQPPRASGGGGRKWLIGGAVVGVLALGGAAFGAYTWLTSTGPQPAEALPADTLGYVSIDLDPSGSQKIAALKTLEKFPAADEWLDEEGIGSGDDIRKFIFGKIQEEEGACEGVDFEDDIKPWLGDRFAIAAVDTGDAELPSPVGVVQVKDSDDAQDQAEQLIADCGGDPEDGGLAMTGDWLIIAETDEIAEQVADDAAEANLADDQDFQKWTDAAGDPGILTAYAAPAAGKVLSDAFAGLASLPGATDCLMEMPVPDGSGELDSLTEGCLDGSGEMPMPDEAIKMFEDFGGLAMTVRFDDGSLEVEWAGDNTAMATEALTDSDAGGDVISTLPDDTAAAFGIGFEPGWFEDMVDYVALMSGDDLDIDQFFAEAEQMFDLSLPEDAETLVGESTAIAIGSDFDPDAFVNAPDPSQLQIGAKIKGDTDAIQDVLDRVKATAPSPEEAEIFSSESDDEHIVIGPNTDYLSDLLADGELGDSEVYQDVVREDDPSMVFFVNFDAGDDWLSSLAGDDSEIRDNLDPLSGLGVTAWVDEGVSHSVLRLTTD